MGVAVEDERRHIDAWCLRRALAKIFQEQIRKLNEIARVKVRVSFVMKS